MIFNNSDVVGGDLQFVFDLPVRTVWMTADCEWRLLNAFGNPECACSSISSESVGESPDHLVRITVRIGGTAEWMSSECRSAHDDNAFESSVVWRENRPEEIYSHITVTQRSSDNRQALLNDFSLITPLMTPNWQVGGDVPSRKEIVDEAC